MASETSVNEESITIKKYANRRLYNTSTSSYVTLDNLCTMVKNGQDFHVVDAKSGDDITRSVLTQIIFEEESKGQNLLPIEFLRQLIKFYGDSMQSFVPSYLKLSMEQFTRNQEQFRGALANAWGNAAAPFAQHYEDQIRQNMAIFERALNMFSPFSGHAAGPSGDGTQTAAASEAKEAKEEIDQLKAQLKSMQDRLDAMEKD